MFPRFPIYDHGNVGLSEPVNCSESGKAISFGLRDILGTNLQNLTGSKLVHPVPFSYRPLFGFRVPSVSGSSSESLGMQPRASAIPECVSLLGNAVTCIVGYCSRPKMIWINARRVVARMANEKFLTYIGIDLEEYQPVRWKCIFFLRGHAISRGPLTSRPNPAFSKLFSVRMLRAFLINLLPKIPFLSFRRFVDLSCSSHSSSFRLIVSARSVLNTLLGRGYCMGIPKTFNFVT
jgi:hypothetical protein